VLADLERAFNKFRRDRCLGLGETRSPLDFKDSLRELEGTFIKIHAVTGGSLVQFHNPSIRDFIEPKVFNEDVFETVVSSAVFFDQLSWCYGWLDDGEDIALRDQDTGFNNLEKEMIRLYRDPACAVVHRLSESSGERIFRGTLDPGRRLSQIVEAGTRSGSTVGFEFAEAILENLTTEVLEERTSPNEAAEIIFYLRAFELRETRAESSLVMAIKKKLLESVDEMEDFEAIVGIKENISGAFSKIEWDYIRSKFKEYLEDKRDELFGFHNDDPDQIRGVGERVEILGRDLNVDTKLVEAYINERADDKQTQIDENQDWDPDDEERPQRGGGIDFFSNSDLESMFRTLE